MKRAVPAFLACFVVTFGASGLIAGGAISPLFRGDFGAAMRAPSDGGGIVVMAIGFAVMCAAIVALTPRVRFGRGWIVDGLAVGAAAAAVVAADYCILVGWSSLPPRATVLSGLLSTFAPILGALAAALVTRRDRAAVAERARAAT
jgi:hypothetical protein